MTNTLDENSHNPLIACLNFIQCCCSQYSKTPIYMLVKLALLIQIPAIIFASTLHIVFGYQMGSYMENNIYAVFTVGFIGPAFDTLMIALGYGICHSFSWNERRTLAINAVFFAGLHCFLDPVRFFPALWAFLFFCAAYHVGHQGSFTQGFLLSFSLHIACNCIAIGLFLLGVYFP